MAIPYVDLFVRVPEGNGYNSPDALVRVDEHVQKYTGLFHRPDGKILQEPDGSFRVRVMLPEMVGVVKFVLTTQYGLVVEKEEFHS